MTNLLKTLKKYNVTAAAEVEIVKPLKSNNKENKYYQLTLDFKN